MSRKIFLFIANALFLFVFPSISFGANIFFPGNGSASIGRAGAVVASGKTVEAVYFNPANLGYLKGYGVRLDSSLSFQRMDFLRQSEKYALTEYTYDRVEKDPAPVFIPFLSMWASFSDIGPGRLSFSLFAFAPNGRTNYNYPEKKGKCTTSKDPKKDGVARVCDPMSEPGPQRLTVITSASPLVYTGLAAAYRLSTPFGIGLSIGATFKAAYMQAAQRVSVISASLLYRPTAKKVSSGELIMDLATEGWYFTADFGVTLELPGNLKLAASILLPATATLDGTLDLEINKMSASLMKVYGRNVALTVPFPLIFRTGLAWQNDKFAAEIAAVVEFWGDVEQKMNVISKDIELEIMGKKSKLEDVAIDQILHNSISLRAGVQYNLFRFLALKAGFLWSSGSVDKNRINALSIDAPNKIGLSAGLTAMLPFGGLHVDLSILHIFDQEIVITDSLTMPTDVSPTGLKAPKAPGSTSNGTYHLGMTVLSLGIRGSWGS